MSKWNGMIEIGMRARYERKWDKMEWNSESEMRMN